MSNATKKPSTPTHQSRRVSGTDQQTSPSSVRNRPQSPSTSNGLGRSLSTRQSTPVSARAAARRPGAGRSNLSTSSINRNLLNNSDDEARAANAAIIEELKEQIQKAEITTEQYQKQLGVLQMRLDDAVSEQGRLEEQAHEKDNTINSLREEIRELTRQLREMEQAHEMERAAMIKDKEAQASREEELQATIQRLKETIAQKDLRMSVENERNLSRSPSFRNRSTDGENGQFAPSSQIERSPSRNNSQLILQKDKLIESLRLELAEAQIKLVEMENLGGGRQQDLERELMEVKMANARLMEDNESYQLLLSEKTLNGDFTKVDFLHGPNTSSAVGSLADELESAVGEEVESRRKLENEIKALKDQNKALSLYIERIIGRLLQTDGFEHILDKNDDAPVPPVKSANKDKELPPPPQEKPETAAQTFLQRARSVVSRPQSQTQQPQPRTRPPSQLTQSSSSEPRSESPHPTPHEDPVTAPSIPIGRSRTIHRRTRSDQAEGAAAAAVVGQMYRGPAGRSPSTGQMSPGFSPTLSGQGAFFAGSNLASKRASMPGGSMSLRSMERVVSSRGSVASDRSGEVMSTGGASSPPRSGMNNYPGAVMTQSKLRPLRLVQENQEMGLGKTAEEEEAARRKGNRTSWLPWFNQSKKPDSAGS
ncbi:hypothetical protein VTO42DRAFT_8627 [Malbranchea cinnamomea]